MRAQTRQMLTFGFEFEFLAQPEKLDEGAAHDSSFVPERFHETSLAKKLVS